MRVTLISLIISPRIILDVFARYLRRETDVRRELLVF
jgi:hypothetical protein